MITRRRMLAATGGLAALAAVGPEAAFADKKLTDPTRLRNGTMEIRRGGSQPSAKGPAEHFTGAVRVDPLFDAPDPARVSCASVTFEPGAHTTWHTHPLGQTLIVTSGVGWTQCWGGPVEEIGVAGRFAKNRTLRVLQAVRRHDARDGRLTDVVEALSHQASRGRFRILERQAKLLKSLVSTPTHKRVITSKNRFP
ncbi:hypothetical protein SAMN05444161_8554 [Rhizobiales bacterium GAS191]|nr:hypothetical protein SAMN05444161_8554 [Rhizobiales bacterium GAS191]